MSLSVVETGRQARLEEAGTWCLRLSEGALSIDEQAAFDAWIDADPENLDAFERTVRVWQRFGAAATTPEFIEVRERALATYRRRNQARWSAPSGSRRALWSIAACLVLAFVAGVLWLQSQPDIYRTAVGERRLVVLADGSRISLDAATRVDVRLEKDRRVLVLRQGRAKFDVARDPFRPFSVAAGDKTVVATGTSFSVELLRRQMHVVLYEGQVAVVEKAASGAGAVPVRLKGKGGAADRLLRPGSELVVNMSQPTASVAPTDLARSLSWEVGQLTFIDEPLYSAVERVNRYSTRKIELTDARAAKLEINGVFNTGDVDAFIVGVRETLPVRITPEGGTVAIASER
ncbi:MAG: FecR family protein [Sphingobium sp.]